MLLEAEVGRGAEPVELLSRPMPCAHAPLDVLRLLGDEPLPFLFAGDWLPQGALVGSSPRTVRSGAGIDYFAALDDLAPSLRRDDGFVGGGWFGYFGYELAHRVEHFPPGATGPAQATSPGFLAYHDNVLRFDEAMGAWHFEALVTPGRAEAIDRRFEALAAVLGGPRPGPRPFACGPYRCSPPAADHEEAVRRAIDYIHGGDIFQANICLTLDASFTGDAAELFCTGAAALRPAYAAYLGTAEGAVCSFSPELFLRRTGTELVSSPIKGTAARTTGADDVAESQRGALVASAKDRAENVMIVDLMRNDISRVASAGSVQVAELLRAEPHPGVWHLVSDVVGTCRPGIGDGDILAATFPPGSVTGAPKVRALEVISELESGPRGVYTGAIGFQSPCAGLVLNVAIRTFEVRGDRITLGVGGGIVADSDPGLELEECFVKARPLLAATGGCLAEPRAEDVGATHRARRPLAAAGLFETVRVEGTRAPWLAEHLRRLDASAREVLGLGLPPTLVAAVDRELARGQRGVRRLRIGVRLSSGQLHTTVTSSPLEPDAPLRLVAVASEVSLGAHKWQDRRLVDHLRSALVGDENAVLLLDEAGAVLEADTGTVFAVIQGELRTPALDGRILPGVARAGVLARAAELGVVVREGPLSVDELGSADEVFVTNALRGVRPVVSCRGVGSWRPGPVAAALQDALEASWRVRWRRGGARHRALLAPSPARSTSGGRRLPSLLGDHRPLVVVIDNYDSFAYNLVHHLEVCGAATLVVRNDVSIGDVERLRPDAVVISPGPCSPAEAGVSNDVIRRMGATTPILGVCLGHECIGEVFGAIVVRSAQPMHGKTSRIFHDGEGVFDGVPQAFAATRYHSLELAEASIPPVLRVTARTPDGVVMGVRHTTFPVQGVQFHPESCITEHGIKMLTNFLAQLLLNATATNRE